MTENILIRHSLDFMVSLADAATGGVIVSRRVEFYQDGERREAVRKEPGVYAFVNTGRSSFVLTVRAAGYREATVHMEGETLCREVPYLQLYMLPGEDYPLKNLIHTISGTLKGIESIEGILWGAWQMRIREFEEKTRTIRLFNPHGGSLYTTDYGVVNQERQTFEVFSAIRQVSAEEVQIRDPLKQKFEVNSPVERVVPGWVSGGRYCLSLQGGEETYLVRWRVRGRFHYRELDLSRGGWDSLD